MQATKETVQKRPHTALWVILCVVLLCAAGAALYFCRWAEKPLTLAEGYVAAEGLTADITDGEGAVLSQPVRGTKVTYVVEDEDKDHPGLVRLVLGLLVLLLLVLRLSQRYGLNQLLLVQR